MLSTLLHCKKQSFCTIAVDYKPVFGAGLLDAFTIASTHKDWDLINGTGAAIHLNCFSRAPRWSMSIFPQRIQASFLPITELLDGESRRIVSNLVHKLLTTMRVETATRIGVQVTSIISHGGIEFSVFAEDFAKQIIRSPIYDLLGITEIDPLVKLTGKDQESNFTVATVLAPMSREHASIHIRESAIKGFAALDNLENEAYRSYVFAIDETNLLFESDIGAPDVPVANFRTSLDKQLSYIDSRLDVTLKFLAIGK